MTSPVPDGYALRTITRDGELVRQLRCPGCGAWADVDDDQYHGRISAFHDPKEGGCGWHETHDFAALEHEVSG